MASPLEQFEVQTIVPLGVAGYDISFTNSSLWMVLSLVGIWLFMVLGMRRTALVPGRWQSAVESMYELTAGLLDQNVGPKGRKYLPLIFSIFMFILVMNLFGLLPIGIIPGLHAFTVTSHIVVTALLAVIVFAVVLFVGFARHGLHFLSLFVPKDVPWWVLPLMIPLEFISFMLRPFTLAVRLFANMTAGHILLKVFAGFVISLGGLGALGVASSLLPLAAVVAISALEILVAVIQAYVFALLASFYLNDAVNLH